MQGAIEKWGDTAAVRIPRAVLDAANLRLGQPVDVRAEAGRIVIAPRHLPHYDLDALIAGITGENRHDPVEIGAPVGNEVW